MIGVNVTFEYDGDFDRARVIEVAELHIDKDAHRVTVGNEEVSLTALEFTLLVTLVERGEDAGLDEGAPVYGYPGLSGCYAQYVRCPVEQLAPIPAGLPWTDAAGAPIDALTAHQGLTDVLSVGRGDEVLITAGAGGLGHLAVQIARNLGARIVATASGWVMYGSPDLRRWSRCFSSATS